MARYIDVDRIVFWIRYVSSNGLYSDVRKVAFSDEIARIPTADVLEVKHGKWMKVQELSPRYVCTCCRHLFNNMGYKYCPNCGAKMDGKALKERERE